MLKTSLQPTVSLFSSLLSHSHESIHHLTVGTRSLISHCTTAPEPPLVVIRFTGTTSGRQLLHRNTTSMVINFQSVLIFSTILRVLLIIYGDWQDSHMEVRYTDVDYLVFSDAATLMSSGESPFKRTTYRYSPLLAFLLIPNAIFHRSWGKYLFSAADMGVY